MADMKKFMITNWCGIPHKFIRHADGTLAVERIQEMLDAGINLMSAYDYGYATNCEMLAASEKLGMRVNIMDGRIDKAVHHAATREERYALLREVVRDYAGYPTLHGYHIVDEPNSGAFPKLAEIREILSELDPAHEAYYNLFPNYASLEMLGNPSYYDHVDQFIKDVKPEILSYDHYHFCKGEPMEKKDLGDERQNQIYEAAFSKVERAGFFDNIEDVRACCLAHDMPFMIIILVVEHGPYRNLTEAEIRWEVFQSLAYGTKRLSYFTYWCPGVDRDEGEDFWHWQNAMITKEGERTAHYDMIREINKELLPMGNILLDRKSLGVYHFGKVPDKKVTYWQGSFGDITSMSAANATVGFFEGGYMVLANKDYDNAMPVSFATTEGKRVRKYDKTSGLWTDMTPADGQYKITLAAGDGEMIWVN